MVIGEDGIRLPELTPLSTEAVMLPNGLMHLPRATQTFREDHKVTAPKANGITRLRCDRHVPLQQKTRFPFGVGPGETAHSARPNRPFVHGLIDDQIARTRRSDSDGHAFNRERSRETGTTHPEQQTSSDWESEPRPSVASMDAPRHSERGPSGGELMIHASMHQHRRWRRENWWP